MVAPIGWLRCSTHVVAVGVARDRIVVTLQWARSTALSTRVHYEPRRMHAFYDSATSSSVRSCHVVLDETVRSVSDHVLLVVDLEVA